MMKKALFLTLALIGVVSAEAIRVAVLTSSFGRYSDLEQILESDPRILDVTRFGISSTLPPLYQLLIFDCVIATGSFTVCDPVAYGDLLADYVDEGGGVLCVREAMLGSYSYYESAPTGRWEAEGYCPYECISSLLINEDMDLIIDQPSHSIFDGVDGVDDVPLRVRTALRSGAYELAHFVDAGGVAVNEDETVVGVNYSAENDPYWTGDGWLLLANAACWLCDYSSVSEASWGCIKALGD